MTSAFDFYMPLIDLSEICKVPTQKYNSSRKIRQTIRRRDYITKKWHETHTYKLLMYGIQNVNQYDLMCANALIQYKVLNKQIAMGNCITNHTKMFINNLNKFNSMKQEIANMEDYINKLKSDLYNIVSSSQYLFREHRKEVLAFVNSSLNTFTD